MPEVRDGKITQEQAGRLQAPIELDLTAYFNILQEAVIETMNNAVKAGVTPDELIRQIEDLFNDDGVELEAVQKAVGNISGFVEYAGFPVTIENRAGTVRRGVDEDGALWSILMLHDYGYIRLTEGADGDEVDVYLGPAPDSRVVYIIHQNNPDTGYYDEDKVMLGFQSAEAAKLAYYAVYNRLGFFAGITMVTIEEFKDLLSVKAGSGLISKKKSLYIELIKAGISPTLNNYNGGRYADSQTPNG